MGNKLNELLRDNHFGELRAYLTKQNEVDIAQELEHLSELDMLLVFRLLPKNVAADTFAYMSSDAQESLIVAMDDVELSAVLQELALDDTVDMLEELPANVVKRVLASCDMQYRASINSFLNYPEDSAGSLMTIEYIDLRAGMTVEQSFARIRKTGIHKETIYTCYVIDDNRLLLGVVTVKELILAEAQEILGDIMEKNVICAQTLDDRENVANLFDKYDFLAIPVVDTEHRLVGIITVDDAIDAIQEENTEDFERMAALSPSDESYLKTTVFTHARRRVAWLLVLMLSAIITGNIINKYEGAFEALPVLVAFIPMIMDTGGNCGSQSSTLIIRGMALSELHPKDWLRIVWKETRVALLVGGILALVNGARIWLQYSSGAIALTVGVTLMATVLLSKVIGCTLPIVAKKLGADPAIMAAPIITTLVDGFSIFIYFNVALLILRP